MRYPTITQTAWFGKLYVRKDKHKTPRQMFLPGLLWLLRSALVNPGKVAVAGARRIKVGADVSVKGFGEVVA